MAVLQAFFDFWPLGSVFFPGITLIFGNNRETGFARLHPPPPSLSKPATDSSLAERPFLRPFSARGSLRFRSLHGDIAIRSRLARLSPSAKIPFQTRRHSAEPPSGSDIRTFGCPLVKTFIHEWSSLSIR